MELPFLGIGVASQVKPLVDAHPLAAAVVTSVTTELAMGMLVRAIQTQIQPPRTHYRRSSFLPRFGAVGAPIKKGGRQA
jgi:hypothetical protein